MYAPHHLPQTPTLPALGALVFSGCGGKVTGRIPEPSGSSYFVASVTAGEGTFEGVTAEAAAHYCGGFKTPKGSIVLPMSRVLPRVCLNRFSCRG